LAIRQLLVNISPARSSTTTHSEEQLMKHVKTIAACAVDARSAVEPVDAVLRVLLDQRLDARREVAHGDRAVLDVAAVDHAGGCGAGSAHAECDDCKDGAAGANGKDGRDGKAGTNGRDGVRWERVTGTCTTGVAGEVMVRDDALKLGLPAIKGPYAQFKIPAENLSLADVAALSFRHKVALAMST
jgi:hypothetical protein